MYDDMKGHDARIYRAPLVSFYINRRYLIWSMESFINPSSSRFAADTAIRLNVRILLSGVQCSH